MPAAPSGYRSRPTEVRRGGRQVPRVTSTRSPTSPDSQDRCERPTRHKGRRDRPQPVQRENRRPCRVAAGQPGQRPRHHSVPIAATTWHSPESPEAARKQHLGHPGPTYRSSSYRGYAVRQCRRRALGRCQSGDQWSELAAGGPAPVPGQLGRPSLRLTCDQKLAQTVLAPAC
jgi:hypothetical protein